MYDTLLRVTQPYNTVTGACDVPALANEGKKKANITLAELWDGQNWERVGW
jgi:hypothetical protein